MVLFDRKSISVWDEENEEAEQAEGDKSKAEGDKAEAKGCKSAASAVGIHCPQSLTCIVLIEILNVNVIVLLYFDILNVCTLNV